MSEDPRTPDARAADARIDAWARSRRGAGAPAGFADRVMDRIADPRRERWLRRGAVALAVVAVGARLAATVVLFLTR